MGHRPTLVTILAVLFGIGVVCCLLLAVGMGTLVNTIHYGDIPAFPGGPIVVLLESLSTALAVVFGIFGLILAALTYGFWKGKNWSRWIFIILESLALLGSFYQLISPAVANVVGIVPSLDWTSLPGIIISVILLWYMFRANVRAFFKA